MKNTTIQIKIDNFEGPIDLLLHLVNKNKVGINEINMSNLIDEYIEIIKTEEEKNLKIKVEFLIMATRLLEIKANRLLKLSQEYDRDINGNDTDDLELFIALLHQLSSMVKENNISYENFDNNNDSINTYDNSFTKHDFSDLTIENFITSVQKLFKENEERINELNANKLIINLEEEYTTEDATEEIIKIFKNSNDTKIDFINLIKKNNKKSRIVSIFLCVLEMFKNNFIDIVEEENNFFLIKK